MKKLIMVCAVLLAAATALAYSEHKGTLTLDDCSYDYTYKLYDSGTSNVVINLAKPIAPDVSIPSHIEGAPVVEIAGGRYAGAFGDCTNMTSIAIPGTIQTIGVCAFANCKDLVAVHITDLAAWCTVSINYWSETWSTPDSLRPTSNPLYFAQHLYLNGELVTDLVVPDGITSINGGFAYYTNLTSLVISDSVKQLSWGAFKRCTGLKSVDTGNGLTSLVNAAISGCTNLEDVRIGTNIATLSSTTFRCEGPFYNTGLKDVTIPGNVKNISAYGNHYGYSNSNGPFAECPYLTNVVLQSGVCDIGENAFDRSSRLINVEIPNTVTNIGTRAFAQCSQLTNIEIPNTVLNIGDWAFRGCVNLESISALDNVAKIGDGAFNNCESLESITLSGNLKSIGHDAFSQCPKLTSVYIDDLAKWCQISFPIYDNKPSSVGHPLKDGAELYVAGVSVGKSLDIPYSVDRIAPYAFYGMPNITSVTIPDSVEAIGAGAFASCSALQDLSLGYHVKSIGNRAFYGCSALTDVDFPDAVTSIGEEAFSGCKSLTGIIVPNTVTSLGRSAFANCSNLKAALLGSGLNSVPSSTFSSCSKLENVTIEGDVTAIGGYAFQNCSSLKGFQIPRNVTSIGLGAFSRCRELTNIVLPESLIEMGEWAFSDCTGLTSIVVPRGVEKIMYQVFMGCSGLKSVAMLNSMASIDTGMFKDCTSLRNVILPQNLTSIGASVFQNCTNMTSVVFTGNAPTVGSSAFSGVKAGCTAYVPWGSTGWGVAIPGKWNGLDIAYLFTEKSEVAEDELPETVAVQPGADVTVRVNHEMLVAQLHALIARFFAMSRDGRQDANYFRVKGDYDPAKSIVTLKAVIDEEKIGLDETLAEVAGDEALSSFREDGTMRLTSVKDGFYYGLAAAGRLEDIDGAVEAVYAGGLTQAVDGKVSLSADRPTGGTAFFKVVVSDSER